jgi:hypothetical protein
MPTDDRKETKDEIRMQANPPVEDLSPNAQDEPAAEQVKGGATTTTSGGDGGGAVAGRANFDVFTSSKG